MNASHLFSVLRCDIASIFYAAAPAVYFDGTGVLRAVTAPPPALAADALFSAVYDGLPVRFVSHVDDEAILMLRWCGALYLRQCPRETDRRVIVAGKSGERIAVVTIDDAQIDAVDRLMAETTVAV